MSRCIICNYCSDFDSDQTNYIATGHDLCIKCHNAVSEAAYELSLDDDETDIDLESEIRIDVEALRKAVQGNLGEGEVVPMPETKTAAGGPSVEEESIDG